MLIDYSMEGSLGRLTLSNPPANHLESPVFADADALADFAADPRLTGLLVCGRGRHFCGGADPESLAKGREDVPGLARDLGQGKAILEALSFATIPVVAAIRGQCLGAGLEIALACHFRIAASSAMFGFPETSLGVIPGLGGTLADPGRLSRRTLVELVLSGRMVGADEALEMGLVDTIVPVGDLEETAERRLRDLVGDRTPEVIRAAMESIHNGRRLPREEALIRETELFCSLVRGTR